MGFLLGTGILIGIDLYLSYIRLVRYGSRVELNPVARTVSNDYGPAVAVAFLGAYNLALLGLIEYYHSDTALHVLFGARLGLALMQAKSLQLETFVEQILRKVKEKKNESQNAS